LQKDIFNNLSRNSIDAPVNERGQTFLHRLILDNGDKRLGEAKKLLQQGADFLQAEESGQTPLYYAVIKNCPKILQLFIDHGASGHLNTSQHKDGIQSYYLINAAVHFSCLDSLRVLIENGANIQKLNKDGASPLHAAVINANPDMVDLLISQGADIEKYDVRENRSLILSLLKTKEWTPDHQAVLKSLLRNGADPDSLTSNGQQSVLYVAAEKGFTQAVHTLLQAGGDPNLETNKQHPALLPAVTSNSLSTIKTLLKFGADPDGSKEKPGSPLNQAVMRGDYENVRALLDGGANPNLSSHATGYNPITQAAFEEDLKMMELLKEYNVDPNSICDLGTPALSAAIRHNTLSNNIVEWLLENGANPDKQDRGSGNTALHFANSYSNINTVNRLLEANADPLIENKAGQTPYAHACDLYGDLHPISLRLKLAEEAALVTKEIELKAPAFSKAPKFKK